MAEISGHIVDSFMHFLDQHTKNYVKGGHCEFYNDQGEVTLLRVCLSVCVPDHRF